MKATDVFAILAAFAGLAGSGLLNVFGDSVEAWAPGWGKKTVAVLTSTCYVAAIVVYIWKNRTGAPATAITSNAAVVAPGTQVVTEATPVVGQNVTATPLGQINLPPSSVVTLGPS